MPKLELWKSSDKRPEFVVGGLAVQRAAEYTAHQTAGGSTTGGAELGCAGRGGQTGFALFYVLFCEVGFVGRVELGREEGEEEVEQVDEECVADNVPALGEDDAQHEEEEQTSGGRPSVERIRRGGVEECLVPLLQPVGVREELLDLRGRRRAQPVVRIVGSHHLENQSVDALAQRREA